MSNIRPLFRTFAFTVALSAGLCFAPSAAADDTATAEPSTLIEALRQGSVSGNFRYRFETVDEDRFPDSAEASTLRTALIYTSGSWRGWTLKLSAENIAAIFDDDDYNNAGRDGLNNGVRGVPVIADPELTDMWEASLTYRGDKLTAVLGRQEINLGDQRFVGAVGWRQHHQSFDAARFKIKASDAVTVDYSYIGRVHRIFGDDLGIAGHLLYVPIKAADGHDLTAYGFQLDYDVPHPFSTLTYGLEYVLKTKLSDTVGLRVELEAAQQKDAGDNPLEVDTEYLLASTGWSFGKLGIDLTWESLGEAGDGARAFATPLATLHKFNGWADKFLATPSTGLETLYLRFKGKFDDGFKWQVSYQDFTSAAGGLDFGTEIDAELVYTAPWKQSFGLKVADYDADTFATDTRKLWLWTAVGF